MEKENRFEHASDHVVWEYLKLQDAEAWKLVWERAVLAEVESYRSATKVRDWGVPAEELMSLLYVEMVGGGKLALYRDDGGSLWGWMRTYVRGYILRAQPDSRLSSLERAGETARVRGKSFAVPVRLARAGRLAHRRPCGAASGTMGARAEVLCRSLPEEPDAGVRPLAEAPHEPVFDGNQEHARHEFRGERGSDVLPGGEGHAESEGAT